MIASFYPSIYSPAADLAAALIGIPRTRPADILMLAIAGQESRWTHRAQIGGGPARGFWQFEKGGGVAGVLAHRASSERARSLCTALRIEADAATVYEALRWNDTLAVGFARLLLWTDPKALPTEPGPAWDCYIRTWRPGKPHQATWQARWDAAMSVV
tara:strand:+ start:16411 stop:16884 length:474 start_codon:yes stop_codon:yes gene_type:complete